MMTKLEAVNIMLDAIGEEPVSSLASGLPDAEKAERMLDQVSKEVQAKGWHCNSDYDVKLVRDENSRIRLPINVLRIDTSSFDKTLNVTVRRQGNLLWLYNVKDRTFTFDKDITCDIVWEFPFEDLTYELQAYIAAKAARKFQASELGSVAMDGFAVRNEQEAWAALQDAEAESEDSNILTDSPYAREVVRRYNVFYGR